MSYFDEGAYDRALDHLLEALEREPDNKEYAHYIALCKKHISQSGNKDELIW